MYTSVTIITSISWLATILMQGQEWCLGALLPQYLLHVNFVFPCRTQHCYLSSTFQNTLITMWWERTNLVLVPMEIFIPFACSQTLTKNWPWRRWVSFKKLEGEFARRLQQSVFVVQKQWMTVIHCTRSWFSYSRVGQKRMKNDESQWMRVQQEFPSSFQKYYYN